MDEHLSCLERIGADGTGRVQVREIPEFMLPYRDRRTPASSRDVSDAGIARTA
ncbi:hypothetical protein [Micromonospora sp. NPDC048830]|uniref:hypothetical protein n=1 Tax=Micromonospora sp. NPDC048830 TaxID=3364257 RepID=UPI00371075EF